MTEEEQREAHRRERYTTMLVETLMFFLGVERSDSRCTKCDSTGQWQDGGDCGQCSGAGYTFAFKRPL